METIKSTGLVTGFTILNGLLGFIFFWLMARALSPSGYGSFSIAIAAAGLITDISTVGTETGVINFVGKFLKTDYEKALRFLKLAFKTKIIVSFLVLVIGWFLMPIIAVNILAKPELTSALRFSLFAAASLLLFGFATSSLQAIQKFVVWGLVNIISNLGRLILVGLFFVLGALTLNSSLIIYITIPFIAFCFSFFFLPNFLKVKNENKIASEFFHYNKWVSIFTLIAALSSRLDTFFVARISGLGEVGIYSVSVTLVSVIPQIVGAVGTVVAPKLAGVGTRSQALIYLKKLQIFVGALALAGIFSGTLVGYFLIHRFYKPEYFPSFWPFIILLFAQAMFLFSIPVHMAVIYYFSYPKLFVLVSTINLIIVSLLCLVLIPAFGILGASAGVLVGNISNFLIPAFWVVNKFREK